MGGSESKSVVIREVESAESLEYRMRGTLKSQLEEMKSDVKQVVPAIDENVIKTINEIEDALILRYSQLDDRSKIAENVRQILGAGSIQQVTAFIVDAAEKMIYAMHSTDEMKEVMRWQMRKQVIKVGSQVIGMEAHYRVKVLEEKSKNYVTKDTKDTVVIIGYKILVHSLQENPADMLTGEQLKTLSF